MTTANETNMHELAKSAFFNSELKSNNFVYIDVSLCTFHLLFEGNLYAFKANPDNIENPTICAIKKQVDVDFTNKLDRNHVDYVAIKQIWMDGLLHHLFCVFHIGNLEHAGKNIERYFLYKLVEGYKPRKSLATVKCIQKRTAPSEIPRWEVTYDGGTYEFIADNKSEASAKAKEHLDLNGLAYRDIIHLR